MRSVGSAPTVRIWSVIAALALGGLGAVLVSPAHAQRTPVSAAVPLTDPTSSPTSTTAPRTRFTGGTPGNSFVVGPVATFSYRADQRGSTFVCALDGIEADCSSASITFDTLSPGQHTFSVQAVNTEGTADPSPATRRFSVMRQESYFEVGTGWRRIRTGGAYGGRLLQSSLPEATLTLDVSRLTRLAILIGKGPHLGSFSVAINNRVFATVSETASSRQLQVLVPLKGFGAPANGTLTITALGEEPVQIDGVGVFRS